MKYIEGLLNLKKLRILNISNNLLCSFSELIFFYAFIIKVVLYKWGIGDWAQSPIPI